MPGSQAITNELGSTRERALWWAARRYNAEAAVRRWHPSPGARAEAVDGRWTQIVDDDLGRSHATAAARYARRRSLALADEHRTLLARLPDSWRVMLGLRGTSVEMLAVRLGLEMVALSVRAVDNDKALKAILSAIGEHEADLLVTRINELADHAVPQALADCWPGQVAQTMQRMAGTKLLRTLGLTQLAAVMHYDMDPRQQAVAARHCRSQLIAVLCSAAPGPSLNTQAADALEPVLKEVLGQVSGGRR